MNTAMQSKKLPLLGAILGVQMVIAGALFWGTSDPVTAVNEPLFSASSKDVNQLLIEGEEDSLLLSKEADQWRLPNGLPAASARVNSFLETVVSLKTQWPVANTTAAAERFEVAEDQFQRKITLKQNEQELGSVYLGTSPGFNQSHVRLPGEQDIYALKINTFDAQPQANNWLDTTLLQPQGELEFIQSTDYTFTKVEGQWSETEGESAVAQTTPEDQESGAEGSEVSSSEKPLGVDIDAFSQALTTLRVAGLAENIADLDALEKGSSDEENAFSVITWKVKTSEHEYQYKLLKKGEEFYMQRDDYPHTFRVAQLQYDSFSVIKKNALDVAQN